MKWWTLVLVFISSTWAEKDFSCTELKEQESLDIEKLMANKWYVVEILEHNPQPTQPMSTSTKFIVDKCPIIKLRSTINGLLRLLWTEEGGDLDYTFRVPDEKNRPGVWISVALQNGTLSRKAYTQFAGTVHVMKAVAQHIVLTFCAESPGNNLYSLILGREHILTKSQINGIHSLLERRKLRIISTRSTCANGGAISIQSSNVSLTVLTLTSLAFLRFLLPFLSTDHLQ